MATSARMLQAIEDRPSPKSELPAPLAPAPTLEPHLSAKGSAELLAAMQSVHQLSAIFAVRPSMVQPMLRALQRYRDGNCIVDVRRPSHLPAPVTQLVHQLVLCFASVQLTVLTHAIATWHSLLLCVA